MKVKFDDFSVGDLISFEKKFNVRHFRIFQLSVAIKTLSIMTNCTRNRLGTAKILYLFISLLRPFRAWLE